ncbi:ABC transporter ATP-binding protein [Mesorhizobium sp. YIM 152430]|uniref:ABC transporter ATP-binding protein n=1 Tax=Mesorhizobium sp. YIM 152430 TaxID=3031761 RepID=UPI0023D97B0C|nr:ABC transporter ATP-binding protein [Mesorhizobium sp. YIM 152430]MDF1601635.1 ABC transporter ATP-binding protein [Mesorhizobium sp. YIM 152430]
MPPSTTRSDIEVEKLSKIFGSGDDAVRALDDVSLTIPENEFFTLLGPSGCGKTTLLRMIAGFEQPTSGRIRLGGSDIADLPPNKRPVNTVFQSYALFPHMTVAQNIGFALKMLGKPKAEIEATVSEMLKLVKMEPMANRRPAQISGGQQQRVALARALAPRPRVLLLDEPLSALDLKLRKEMQVELKRLQAETGITFIFVTHDQEEALTMSDRIAVMSAGKVLQVGPPREIYNHPAERFVADFIGDTNFIAGKVERANGQSATVRLSSGQALDAGLPKGLSPSEGDQVTLVVRPEHAKLAADGPLKGTVENAVYFGTDTHFHVRLDTGDLFILRSQNAAMPAGLPDTGDAVSIAIPEGAVQVVRG